MEQPITFHAGQYTATVQFIDGDWRLVITVPQVLYATWFSEKFQACRWAHEMLRAYSESDTTLPMRPQPRRHAPSTA